MKQTILILCALCLFGCAGRTPIQEATTDLSNSVSTLEKSLPKDCKTESIKAQISDLKEEIKHAETYCNIQVEKVEAQRNGWATAFFSLVSILVCFWLLKK